MKSRLTPERLTGLYALFLLTVFVLWTPATGYSPIVAPKHRLFLISAGVYFLGLGAVCLYRRQWPQIPKDALWLSGGLALWFLLSSLLSEYPELVWLGDRRREGFLTLFLYLAIFLAMAAFGRLGKLHTYGAAVTGVLLFVLILPQFLGYNPLNLYPEGLCFHDRGARYSGEYLGTIGNSDLLSALLTMLCLYLAGAYAMGKGGLCLLGAGCAWGSLLLSEVTAGPVAVLGCLALALPLWVKKGLGIRRVGDVSLVLSLAALGKSMLGYRYAEGCLTLFPQFTRLSAVSLGLTLCSVMAMVLLRRLPAGKGYPKAARAIWILYALVILAVCLFLFFYGGSNETLLGLRGLLHGDPPDTLGSSRVAIWKEAVELGLERPLLGGGPDTYNRRSQLIFTRLLENGTLRRNGVDAAHNEYLNLWVNTGLPGMLLFLALVLRCLRSGWKRGDMLLLPCLGYAIHALFGISQSLVSPLFYLFLGALLYREAHGMNPDEDA